MKRLILLGLLACFATPVRADGLGTLAARAAKFAIKKFGKEAAEEGAEKLAGRIASAAARHGDDVLAAVKRIGPRALSLADEAGENAPRLMRLLAKHGDDAARVFGRPQALTLLSKYGDEVTEVLIKHQSIAEPVLERLGAPAVKALGAVGARNGRRLAMMAESGELAAFGNTPALMNVIARYGDRAMDFCWRHRAVLVGTAAITAFVTNPEPYLDGAAQITETVTQNVVKPAVVATGNVAQEAAGFVRWTLTIVFVAIVIGVGGAAKSGALEKPWIRDAVGAAAKLAGGAVMKKFTKS